MAVFFTFSKILNKMKYSMCVYIMFLKLNQSRHTKKHNLGGVFLQKPKTRISRGKSKKVFTLKFKQKIAACSLL